MNTDYSNKLILGIESSCDETAVALLRVPNTVLGNLVLSQANIHQEFGGVVPEVASRNHLKNLDPLVKLLFHQLKMCLHQIDAVAATVGPGLAPALLIGSGYAKGLALALKIPYLAINHLEGHLVSPFLKSLSIPRHLALIVSGGHTELVGVEQIGCYTILGKTVDDAAGEAFDKIAKMIGLPYPGGNSLDKLAENGDENAYIFPQALIQEKENLNFSFSGLKTSVRYFIEKNFKLLENKQSVRDICASVRKAIIYPLIIKTERSMIKGKFEILGISGGVSANRYLRRKFSELAIKKGWKIYFPSLEHSTDNACMIAFAGIHRLLNNQKNHISEEIAPSWKLENC